MKKLNFLFVALFAAATVFTSCEGEVLLVAPVVSVELTTENPMFTAGEKLTFKVTATTEGQLEDFTLEADGVEVSTYAFGVDELEVNAEYTIAADAVGGSAIELTFNVSNVDATGDATYTITVAAQNFIEYSATILGGANASEGSCFSTSEGIVYGASDIGTDTEVMAKIDIIYYYGSANAASLACPADTEIEVYSYLNVVAWTPRNVTLYAAAADLDFAEVTFAEVVAAADVTGAEDDINNLAVGSIVAFKTAAGTYGVLKVTELVISDTGNIKIDVKMIPADQTPVS